MPSPAFAEPCRAAFASCHTLCPQPAGLRTLVQAIRSGSRPNDRRSDSAADLYCTDAPQFRSRSAWFDLVSPLPLSAWRLPGRLRQCPLGQSLALSWSPAESTGPTAENWPRARARRPWSCRCTMPPTLAICCWYADSALHLHSIPRLVKTFLLYIAVCPSTDGGLQVGYDELTVANQSASARYYDTQGYRYSQLQYQQLAYSPAVTNASCIFYSFGSNFSTVDAYLITDTNLESMLNSQASLPQLLMFGSRTGPPSHRA